MTTITEKRYRTFAEFYPDYLSEHCNRTCRELHFAGATLALVLAGFALLTASAWWLLASLACLYGLAWIGHGVFEKNRPVSLRHPFYSFIAGWLMYWQMLTGQLSF